MGMMEIMETTTVSWVPCACCGGGFLPRVRLAFANVKGGRLWGLLRGVRGVMTVAHVLPNAQKTRPLQRQM